MKRARYLLSLILVFSVSCVYAQGKEKRRPNFEELKEGAPVSGIIHTTETDEFWQTFYFEVPEDTAAFRLWLSGSQGDLDLYAQPGDSINDYSLVEWYSDIEDWNEEMLVHSLYSENFEEGIWYVDVAYTLDGYARDIQGQILEQLPFELHIEFLPLQVESILLPNEPVSVTLDPEWFAVSWFALEVEEPIETLRIDAFDTHGDIDLLLSRSPIINYGEALVLSESIAGSETLIYKPQEGIEAGTYYLLALDSYSDLDPIDLSLVASYSEAAPEFLQRPITPILDQQGPQGVPIGATVQIIADSAWGTGNIVSEEGWILTNDHVVRGLDGELMDSVIVAVVTDPGYPPKETFRASVVAGQEHPDLALLKIEEGFYGQPIPENYRFPYWQWGNSSDLSLGNAVFIVGFPSVSGSGSRPIYTYTRGYLAGMEQNSIGSTLMTDALISGGSSGGALTAGNGELIAIPSFTIDDAAGQMAFALSLDQVPAAWKVLINTND